MYIIRKDNVLDTFPFRSHFLSKPLVGLDLLCSASCGCEGMAYSTEESQWEWEAGDGTDQWEDYAGNRPDDGMEYVKNEEGTAWICVECGRQADENHLIGKQHVGNVKWYVRGPGNPNHPNYRAPGSSGTGGHQAPPQQAAGDATRWALAPASAAAARPQNEPRQQQQQQPAEQRVLRQLLPQEQPGGQPDGQPQLVQQPQQQPGWQPAGLPKAAPPLPPCPPPGCARGAADSAPVPYRQQVEQLQRIIDEQENTINRLLVDTAEGALQHGRLATRIELLETAANDRAASEAWFPTVSVLQHDRLGVRVEHLEQEFQAMRQWAAKWQ